MKKNLYVTRDKNDYGMVEVWLSDGLCRNEVGSWNSKSVRPEALRGIEIPLAKALGIPVPRKGQGWKLERRTEPLTDKLEATWWVTEKLDPKGGE